MANQANVVINDGQATPVAVTFTASGVKYDAKSDKIIASWYDNSNGTAIGRRGLKATYSNFSKSLSSGGVLEEVYDVELPTLETVAGSTEAGYQAVPKVAFITRSQTKYWLPNRSAVAHRKDVLAFTKNFQAHAVVTAGVVDLDTVS